MQTHANLVDLVKSFPTNNCYKIWRRYGGARALTKFDNLNEKSEKGSISNLSTKVLPYQPPAHNGRHFWGDRCGAGGACGDGRAHRARVERPLA